MAAPCRRRGIAARHRPAAGPPRGSRRRAARRSSSDIAATRAAGVVDARMRSSNRRVACCCQRRRRSHHHAANATSDKHDGEQQPPARRRRPPRRRRRLVDVAQRQVVATASLRPPSDRRATAARIRWARRSTAPARARRAPAVSPARLPPARTNSLRQRCRCAAVARSSSTAMPPASRTAAPRCGGSRSSGSVSSSTIDFVVHRQRRPALFGNRGDAAGIGQHQHPRAGPQQATGVVERERQAAIVLGRPRVPAHQRIEHAQGAARTRGRRDRRFRDAAAQGGDAVAIAHRGPRGDRAGTRGLHRLEAHAGAEIQRRRGVGDDQGQAFAFGLEQLGMRLAAARGQAPVDVARIVADRVLARFRVFHAAPAQRRQRLPADAMAPAPRRPAPLRGGAQGDQFGQRRHDAVAHASWSGSREFDAWDDGCAMPSRIALCAAEIARGAAGSRAITATAPCPATRRPGGRHPSLRRWPRSSATRDGAARPARWRGRRRG